MGRNTWIVMDGGDEAAKEASDTEAASTVTGLKIQK